MAIYTIADLHLSTRDSTNKSMEIFGNRWAGYVDKLKRNWTHLVTPEDTVIIPGDISWAISLEEAECDLRLIDSLPGKKILLKGNHDYWWCTMKKHTEFFERVGISTISFLFNNALKCENYILAGTRGWYYEDSCGAPDNADFDKLVAREGMRLRASLKAAVALRGEEDTEILVFMHFPPVWNGKISENIIEILKEFGIRRVYFGHIHGNYSLPAKYEYDGIELYVVSADYLDFIPKIIK